MRYAPPGLCLNDFAIIEREDDRYELLHLQGPWTNSFDHVHMETSYGRAVSTDLIEWTPLGPGFGVASPGQFDDTAVWTMHPFRHGDGSVMFYTGVTAKPWLDQSVGLARSGGRDGTGWVRHGVSPVVTADPRWYRTEIDMAWRDPFVVRSDDDSRWVMVLCASDASLPLEQSGCVAWATSTDLENWEVHPPLISPGNVDELECPVLERTEHGWVLLGSIGQTRQIECWTAPHLEGPWMRSATPWPSGAYAPRVVTAPDGDRVVLHTVPRRVDLTDEGALCRGMLSQPKRLVTGAGHDPLLVWWDGLDTHLVEESEPAPATAQDVEVRVAIIPISNDTIISVRAKTGDDEVPAVRLIGRELTWGVEGDASFSAISLSGRPLSLRILTVGEFIEVYADDQFVLASSSYRGMPTRITARDARGEIIATNRVRYRTSTRDDASAIWRGPIAR